MQSRLGVSISTLSECIQYLILANFEALPEMLTAKDLEALLQIDRKTIYSYAERGLIPYVRIESHLRFSKHQVARWLEERSFQPRPVNGKGASRQ